MACTCNNVNNSSFNKKKKKKCNGFFIFYLFFGYPAIASIKLFVCIALVVWLFGCMITLVACAVEFLISMQPYYISMAPTRRMIQIRPSVLT